MRVGVRDDIFSTAVQLSHGSPLAAVCARGDLDAALPDARGCFDTKVTSYELALELQADAITGPTTAVCSTQLLKYQEWGYTVLVHHRRHFRMHVYRELWHCWVTLQY